MAEYLEILAAEVEAGNPAKGSTGAKFKNNVLAMFEGDETNPATPRLLPGAHRRPIAGAVQIAHQGSIIESNPGSPGTFVLILAPSSIVFRASIVVPGVYTIAGTTTSKSVSVKVNGAEIVATPATGAFTQNLTLAQGDIVTVNIVGTWEQDDKIADLRLMADYVPVMGQCEYPLRYRVAASDL